MSVDTNVREGVELLGYRLEAVIGLGGMGVVYRAVDVRLKRTVALKLMAPDLALDERFRERFAREAELAMSLEHPNVIPIHDAGKVEDRLFLAMRLVQGGTLGSCLRDARALDPERAVAIARQVANALDAAHAKGLVHRDVKPSNVLLDERDHVYLADFGLTRRLAEPGGRVGDNRSLGTPAYLAPEQIEGGPVDGRADIYSLGCLLFECLTGEPPFDRGSRLATVWAHLEEEPPPASGRRPELVRVDDVLRKAMAKDPVDRYATCGELVDDAERALGITQGGGRRRWLLTAAVALALAILAVALALTLVGGDDATGKSGPVVRENTLVRVDPATNSISKVIDVGRSPLAAVAHGPTVWVYSFDGTVSEVDGAAAEVRHTTKLLPVATYPQWLRGSPLAADSRGVWVLDFDPGEGRGRLTRVLLGARGTRDYPIDGDPRAVALADGAVWLLVGTSSGTEVLRLDPGSGRSRVLARLPEFLEGNGGLVIAGGSAWVMDPSLAVLHRVNLRTGRVEASRDLGDVATPPVYGFGSLWICASNPGSSMLRLDPRTGKTIFAIHSFPAEGGRFAVGHGSLWRHDGPSGDVMRFDPSTGQVIARVRISPTPPIDGQPSLWPSAIAAAAGAVWVAVDKSG